MSEETTSEQFARRLELAISVNRRLAVLMEEGAPVEDPRVQECIKDHHSWVTEYIKRSRSAYLVVADKYRTDDRFPGLYKSYKEGLAEYMGDAIQYYAEQNLIDDPDDTYDPADNQNK